MRILYVNSTHRWGGVKTWCLRSACGLAARGHQVTVAGRRDDPFLTACREAGLPVLPYAFGASWSPAAFLHFWRLIHRERIELVVCNTGRDLSTAGLAARAAGLPVVHRVGAGADFRDTWARRATHRLVVSRVLVPAGVVRSEMLGRFAWIRPEQALVSWNAAEASPAVVGSGQPDRIVCLARLSHGKGLETLLAAAARLREHGLDFQLDLVGEGPLEGTLHEIVRTLDLDDHVRLPGFLRPASGVLALATVAVLPSLREGFPNTLVEYWAAGLAVVASDLPGVREALGDEEAAMLVPPGDAQALAEALGRLLVDEELRNSLAERGLRRARSCFGCAQEAERLERLYLDCIAARSAR
jgi:glycosyltransferase involved in cell wall biosynthesis